MANFAAFGDEVYGDTSLLKSGSIRYGAVEAAGGEIPRTVPHLGTPPRRHRNY